jgi:SAM-dependent methyltransferase
MQQLIHSHASAATHEDTRGISLRCIRCSAKMGYLENDLGIAVCMECNWQISCKNGIWHALSPQRAEYFSRFIQEYESIRAAEGRGSNTAEYYLQLPYRDISGRNQEQWTIRAHTFRYIERKILRGFFFESPTRLRVLDLGAGNGWMSYRLALRGNFPVAVDLLTNDQDGLGAASHYQSSLQALFPRVQAELDNLPFASNQFDLVIFNASFHYSENYHRTLAEALRCTRAGGAIIIADTAWYSKDESGQAMLLERKAAFSKRYGTASDAIHSLEYLTDERLQSLEESLGVRWQVDQPFYGIQWSLRPLKAHLRNKREPSRFRIYTCRKHS